jgi:cytochrome P450
VTTSSGAAPVVFNPFDPAFVADPYAEYRRMREEAPVYQSPFGLWMLFRYDDAVHLLRDPTLSVEDDNATINFRVQIESAAGDRARRGQRAMLNVDPPDHTRLRGLVSQAFTPRTVEALTTRVQQLVDETLDELVARGTTVDLIADLAFPLPFSVISEMLGMPVADRVQMRTWAHTLTRGLEPLVSSDQLTAIIEASDHMTEHVLDVIRWKRAHPADDVLSALLAAEDHGDTLSPDELRDQVVLLYVAGHETTVNLIGNATFALLRNRAQLERWQRDEQLGANAIEELLRFDSPVQFSRRITTRDIEVAGTPIAKGTLVLTCLGSANHDEARWGARAEDLDLGRDGAAQHLSFGSGVHHCLGASLARLEGRIALGSLVRRFPRLELATDTPAWNGRMVLRGLEELPVALAE